MAEPLTIKFNTPFDKAREAAQRRGVVLPSEYYGKLPKEMRSMANTVSHIQSIEQIKTILDSVNAAIDSGNSFQKWRKEFNPEQFGITKAHAETVYRNALQTQYSVGRWEQAQAAKKNRPYLRYVTINDSRTSECCRALSGIIRPIDDPFWASHTPPNHHNCRSIVVSLTEKEAQKRSPPMVGLNQPLSPQMQPQSGWDYNPALSHGKVLNDLLETKIAKLPKASNWFKKTVREQAAKKIDELLGVVESTPKNQIVETLTPMEKEKFAEFVEKVTVEDYKARHEFVRVGTLPDYVMADAAVIALEPIGSEIHVSDYQLRHSQRPEKSVPLPIDELKKLPEKLENARWFYDSSHDNLIAVFDIPRQKEIGKAVIKINFAKKKKLVNNSIVTSGLIEESTLLMKIYREIKDEP
jgi:SPP1 gp7 family putative phage head morphogenesis protein